MFSHAGAILNHSPLAIQLFRSAEDISEGLSCHSRPVNPILRMFISFKPFNSTGATSLSNHSTVFYFEWALTHKSFPRILPDSSNFPGAIHKFFSKFDVRMNSNQSYFLLQDRLRIIFIFGSIFPLLILPECLNNLVVFLLVILGF